MSGFDGRLKLKLRGKKDLRVDEILGLGGEIHSGDPGFGGAVLEIEVDRLCHD